MTTADPEAAYYQAVEEFFVARRSTRFDIVLLGVVATVLAPLLLALELAAVRRVHAPTGRVLFVLVLSALGGLFGSRVVNDAGSPPTPVALAIARMPGRPPSQVTFLPAFWLLVPGALGLIGVTEIVGDPATATLEDLIEPIGSIIAIALGMLAGVSLFRGLFVGGPHVAGGGARA